MIRFLVLAGYFELVMYLQITGKLNQYINIHYSYLAYISMVLSFILAVVQLMVWMKQMKVHSHLSGKIAKGSSILLLSFPVLTGLLVPTVTLDANTVSAKGYHFPLAAGSDATIAEEDGTSIQYLKPDTSSYFTSSAYEREMTKELKRYQDLDTVEITTENYMEIMELIYQYPDVFVGKTVRYTGFVYNDPQTQGYQFVFRFGIIHCIADSGVYGLASRGAEQHFEDNTWVTVTGTISLDYHQNLKQTLPILNITDMKQVEEPSNPYVYRVF